MNEETLSGEVQIDIPATLVRQENDVMLEILLDAWAWGHTGQRLTVICDGILVTGNPIADDVYGPLLARRLRNNMKNGPTKAHSLKGSLDDLEIVENEFSAEMAELSEKASAAAIGSVLDRAMKEQSTAEAVFGGKIGQDEGESSPRILPRLHISLIEAKLYQSGFSVVELPIWRGKLSHVSSWWIGDENGQSGPTG